MDSGAGVLADVPMFTPESKSDDSIVSPEPAAVSVREPLVVVDIVASAPPPRLRRVESIDRVAAASIDVRPVAESAVSDGSIVNVLLPELRVRVLAPPDVIVPAAVKSRELISRTVPSIVTLPALPPSSIVIDPVVASTSNSVKLIAVAPPLIAVSDVPLSVVVPTRFAMALLTLRIPVPLFADRLIFPVVSPPSVNVLFLRD